MILAECINLSSRFFLTTCLIKVLTGISVVMLAVAAVADEKPGAETLDADYLAGEQLYQSRCVSCHAGAVLKAPQMAALKLYPPERIIESLTSGVMSTTGLSLSASEMQQVAYYMTGKMPTDKTVDLSHAYCGSDVPTKASNKVSAQWAGWGGELNSQRYQANETSLNKQTVKDLELKWAFAFPDTSRMRSQPTVTESMTYIGSQDGTVYALDTDTGCIRWTFQADNEVRGAIKLQADTSGQTAAPSRLLFGDYKANAYALNAKTGALLWKTRVHSHPLASVTGSVTADDKRVYVPVSSSEVVPAAQPTYACCTFRGAVVALNLDDGSLAWRTYTTDKPEPLGKNAVGVDRFGPSGAPVWSGPTLDTKRNLIYATTGQNYSSPATGTSDSVIAMDSVTGEVKWVSQVTANDAWNGACGFTAVNCPEEDGPDYDIGASAILITSKSNRDLLLVGQKSGLTYAMDPDQQGKILWRQRVGSGGTMGGVHWGMSSDAERLYVGVSDLPTKNRYNQGDPYPGVHALDPDTGDFLWRNVLPYECPEGIKFACFQGISAAVSSSPGLVFAGGMDGRLRAFDASSGDILWTYNTFTEFATVNGVKGQGGSIEADGPVIANGQLFVTSGYDKWAEMPGNVLLVFSLPN
ncbi:MAG: PQQ-binding-like beta-propeller repeat protein [Porticoccaceae bacterium]